MKKILLFTLLIGILTNSIFSQDFEKIYKGKDYKYYLGTELKVVGNTIKSILFENLSDVKYNGKNVIYPKNKSGYFSDETKLLGRVFKVEGIIGNDGKDYTGSYGNPSNLPIFKLRDIETLELIYFLYYYRNCTSGYGFPFETKKNFDDYDFCGDIKKEVDDFSDKITYDGDVISESGNYNSILKVVNGSDEVYYLSLRVDGSTVNVGEKGVILLLEDKTKINLPNEDVECKVSSDGSSYEYSSFIRLSDEHIRILKTKEIDKIRLYIYDYDFNKFSSLKFKEYLNCLLNS